MKKIPGEREKNQEELVYGMLLLKRIMTNYAKMALRTNETFRSACV